MTKNVIAVDVGYGNTKVVWNHSIDKLGKERWGETCFRSVAPLMMVDEEKSGGIQNPDRIPLQINGKKYYAGPAASLGIEARALDPNYIETDEHEALLRKCAPLYPDLEKTLKILSSRFPLFIVSNCQAGYIEVFLKSTGFGHYFKGHLCPGDTGMAKAENIMKIREDNNLSDPVYIGDTIGDFNACRKAGVPFIFAEYGFGQVDKPDYRITRPFDLTEICR